VRLLREASAEVVDLRKDSAAHRHLRGRLTALALAIVSLYVVIGAIIWLVGDEGLAGWRAFAWTASQLLTGGSSLTAASPAAHALEGVLQIWAVFVIAALAGSFGAFFHRRGLERDPSETGGY
jgi:succinate dehydrogenase hydrophobic anchor subunit